MQMKAISIEQPAHLVKTLTGAILGCGGWVLSRGANDTGTVSMLFEFERQACVEIYSVLIAAGLDLSQSGHIRFTELCQCTRSHQQNVGMRLPASTWRYRPFRWRRCMVHSPMTRPEVAQPASTNPYRLARPL